MYNLQTGCVHHIDFDGFLENPQWQMTNCFLLCFIECLLRVQHTFENASHTTCLVWFWCSPGLLGQLLDDGWANRGPC